MRTWTLSLILLIGFPSTAHAQVSEQGRSPIIDVHMHVYAEDERWILKTPNPVTGQPLTATTEQDHMQATLAEMNKYNVVTAVVSNDYQVALRWEAVSPDVIMVSYGFDDPSSVDLEFVRGNMPPVG